MNKLFEFARDTAAGRTLIVIGVILAVFGGVTLSMTCHTEIQESGNNLLTSLAFIAAGAASLAGGVVSLARAAKKRKRMRLQEEEWANGR